MSRRSDPPTKKQLSRAAELGIEVPAGATSAQLSKLMGEAPASEEQKRYARDLGINFDSDITSEAMKELLREATPRKNKETIKARGFTEGDVLKHDGQTWLIIKVWGRTHGRLTVKLATISEGKVTTHGRAQVRGAFYFKDAQKLRL